jgi:hypothetical protein
MHLVVVDTAQIQPYIFGSNRLRENIGASHLVAEAAEAWALEAVRTVATQNNVNPDGTLDNTKYIETAPNLDAEVLYAGGGNFVVLFRNVDCTKAFTRTLSRKVLIDAPNLQLVVVQQPFDWGMVLSGTFTATFKKLAEEKQSRSLSTPLLGLGVTVMCQSTGLPAVGVTLPIGGDPGYPASAEIHAKIAVARATSAQPSAADTRLRRDIPPPAGYDYPSDFDDLGGSEGEHSYIAVVHADGNSMGQRIIGIGKTYPTAQGNRAYITALRQFSGAVRAAPKAALISTLEELQSSVRLGKGDRIIHKNAVGKVLTEIELKSTSGGRHYLPFRPIVFGGDDVTFVSDGRLGLSLATGYLRAFEEETAKRPECDGKITACAGIAIVKTHYPFARAYALADGLCRSAKDYRHQQGLEGSCLDWHFALSGLAGGIKEIRTREYTVKAGSLTLRPVTLDTNPKELHKTWSIVRKGIAQFQGENWAGRHNKVKALRDALRGGSDSVKHFLTKFNASKPLPDVEPAMTNWETTGWHGRSCGYFDAIELADWFIPLAGGKADDAGTTPRTQE